MNIIDIPLYEKITTVNFYDTNNQLKYLVFHYTGCVSKARDGANYFYNTYRGASAHYFVDDDEMWQVVKDNRCAWHCGNKIYSWTKHAPFYGLCGNYNSIGIEMCCYEGKGNDFASYKISQKTRENSIKLGAYLMNKYNIDVDHCIRHYDVCEKCCPAPYVLNESLWTSFKEELVKALNELKTTGTIDFNKKPPYVEPYADHGMNINYFINRDIISDRAQWSNGDEYITRSLFITLLDRLTGGTNISIYDDPNAVHWAIKHILSLKSKNIITELNQWDTAEVLDSNISVALMLALVDKATGGTDNSIDLLPGDHWSVLNLKSLAKKGIIGDTNIYINLNFEGTVPKSVAVMLLRHAFYK